MSDTFLIVWFLGSYLFPLTINVVLNSAKPNNLEMSCRYVAGPARIKGCPFAQRRASWCVTLPSRASRQKMAGVPQIPGGLRCLPFHHINSASVLGLLFSHCLSEYEPTSSRSLPSSDEIARPVGRPRPHVGRMASSICLPTHRPPTYFPWRRLDVLQPQGFRS